MRVIMTRKSVC